MRSVGLVHGRFQPLHNGHVALINKMIDECDHAVVLLSVDAIGPWSMVQRWSMVRSVFPDPQKLAIGANVPLFATATDPNWEMLFTSCVITALALPPTDVYAGPDYSVLWSSGVKIHRQKKRMASGCSGSGIRQLLETGNLDTVARLVSPQVMQIILASDAFAQLTSYGDGN